MISVCFQGQWLNIRVIQVYSTTTNAREAEVEWFYEDLQYLLGLTLKKKNVLFIIGDWNAKVVSQEIPGVTGNFGLRVQNEAGKRLTRVLPREYTGHSKHPLITTQERTLHMDITDGQYQNQIDYMLCSWIWKSKQLAKTRLREDCASDHEPIIAKFRLKLKKVGKITRPFKCDLN